MKNARIKPAIMFTAIGLIALVTLAAMAYSTNQTKENPSTGTLSKVVLGVAMTPVVKCDRV
jgi:hypothetical protein